MNQCFKSFFGDGSLIDQRPNLQGLLLRCLASMVHHSGSLIEIINRNPGHCFQNIPILNDPNLLDSLKALVCTKESSLIPQPTGIPPHVKQFQKLDTIIKIQIEDREHTKKWQEELIVAVQNKIEKLSIQSGSITISAAQGLFNDLENKMKGMMSNLLDEKLAELMPSSRHNTSTPSSTLKSQLGGSFTHCWAGRMWDVPEKFMLPNGTTRSKGWRLWLCGIPSQQIKPFRSLKPTMLPKKVHDKFKLEWRPIFDKMEKGIVSSISTNPSSDVVDTTFFRSHALSKDKSLCFYLGKQQI